MTVKTNPEQRERFWQRHQKGESYQVIADDEAVSYECVRYWCRRQRDGGDSQSRYHRVSRGLLATCDPMVKYAVLRLRLENPRWGPNRLGYHLGKRKSLQGMKMPSQTQIGRYLRQWERFRRSPQKKRVIESDQKKQNEFTSDGK